MSHCVQRANNGELEWIKINLTYRPNDSKDCYYVKQNSFNSLKGSTSSFTTNGLILTDNEVADLPDLKVL